RERTAEILRRAAGEGRLDVDELEERLNRTYETRTCRELDTLTADLIAPHERETVQRRMPVRRGEGGANWLISVMGGHERKGRWRVGRHLKVISVMGGSDLDLNDAELSDHDVEMTVFSLMGGSSIHVPDGLNVEVADFAIMGGNDVKLGEHTPDPGGPTLRLRLISIMGGNDIKRGRKLSRAERRAQRHLHH
ncbi:MAG TPA: DUF1707 domain-containing protein, partial [Solirubrobacter sp.]|nr:DUF1707 domain-containing protein [Solirubrobacter sp.]